MTVAVALRATRHELRFTPRLAQRSGYKLVTSAKGSTENTSRASTCRFW